MIQANLERPTLYGRGYCISVRDFEPSMFFTRDPFLKTLQSGNPEMQMNLWMIF